MKTKTMSAWCLACIASLACLVLFNQFAPRSFAAGKAVDPVPPKYADFAALATAFSKGELDSHYFVQVDPDGMGCRLRYSNPQAKDATNDTMNAGCRALFVYVPPPPDILGQMQALGIPVRKSSLPNESKGTK